MAGDWIKMRTDLYRDPKVCLIADALLEEKSNLSRYIYQHLQCDMSVTRNVMRNVTVGALVSVWGVLRHRGKRVNNDLLVRHCTVSVIDDVSDVPGFGDAMVAVGWVIETDDGIQFPNFFEEFNVDPTEEQKKKNAERQRRYREKQSGDSNGLRNVTLTSKSNAREEKRREEIKESKKKSFIPPTEQEVIQYFLDNGYTQESGIKAFRYYSAGNWKDSEGKPVKNWKQKMQGVWFKDENKLNGHALPETPFEKATRIAKERGYEKFKGHAHESPQQFINRITTESTAAQH
jgi:predicted adenine nucleotide alpha hydrolase (AANH) superfamily ATPase